MIAESQNNYLTEKSQMANAIHANLNRGFKKYLKNTLKNTAISMEDLEKLASDRPN